jgi:hypothetical protein
MRAEPAGRPTEAEPKPSSHEGRQPRPAGDPDAYDQDWNPWWWWQEHTVREHYHLPTNPALLRIEVGRLRRARKLWCVRMAPRQYVVQGSSEPVYVDMHGDEPCYCEDALISGRPWCCKHILRALIYERHPKVVAALAAEEAREHRRDQWAHGFIDA